VKLVISGATGIDAAVTLINRLNLERKWSVDISEHKPRRSAQQNRLMWLWLGEISKARLESHGDIISSADLHELFKMHLLTMIEPDAGRPPLKPRLVTLGRAETMISPSTTDRTVGEMARYLELIEMVAMDRWVILLPHPDDLYYASMGIK